MILKSFSPFKLQKMIKRDRPVSDDSPLEVEPSSKSGFPYCHHLSSDLKLKKAFPGLCYKNF
jgi:hypothetical protein